MEICGNCEDVRSEVVYACACGNPVILLCQDCTHFHLSKLYAHTFISLEKARKLIQSPDSKQDLIQRLDKNNRIKLEVEDYIQKMQAFKQDIQDFRSEIIEMIERECQDKLDILSSAETKAEEILEAIKLSLQSSNASEDEFFIKYEAEGLKGILEDYAEKFEINKSGIVEEIASMITIEKASKKTTENSLLLNEQEKKEKIDNSIKADRFIYIAKHHTKNLIKYDSELKQTQLIDLTQDLSRKFNGTIASLLPDDSVMIVGGYKKIATTYRFYPSTGDCTKMKNLNYPRGYIHLYFHDKYLYALGGLEESYSSKAERMDLSGNRWTSLPDMNQKRCFFGSFYSDGKLYLIGGKDNSSVEYYDFMENRFNLVPNAIVPIGGNIVGVVDSQIYCITDKELILLGTSFNIINQNYLQKAESLVNLSDVLVRDQKIIFYCGNEGGLFEVDVQNKNLNKLTSFY